MCVSIYIYKFICPCIFSLMGCPDFCPGAREAWKMPQPMVSESFDREVAMRCPCDTHVMPGPIGDWQFGCF